MQRRELVKILLRAGFESRGGTKHEKFQRGNVQVRVKRHREIDDDTAGKILRQAGLR